MKKRYSHRVNISDKRRDNKKVSDLSNKGHDKKALQSVFNSYYRDQVRALYRAISSGN